jgi:glycosyltransferase involved in cell wall biosynthesis
MFSSQKILFITHESVLSGAPRSLLFFLEWIKLKHPTFQIHVLSLKSENPNQNAFKSIADCYYDFTNVSRTPNYSIKNRIARIVSGKPILSEKQVLINRLVNQKYDLIYANTVVSLPIALNIKNFNVSTKILLHVHEMATAIEQLLPDFQNNVSKIDFFIAASELVKEHLVNFFGCSLNKITRVYECSNVQIRSNSLKMEPIEAKKVVMVGGAYWAKGDDIFLLVAKEVVKRNPNVHFYWLGSQSLERKTVNQGDIIKLGLTDHVHFVPHTTTPHDVVKSMDVFALTSRSDSFPLAAIEAGLLGVPIVCFEKASGIQEIIKQGGGEVVPYLDIQKMAEAIIKLVTSDELRAKYGLEVKDLFQKCKPDVISSEIAQVLTEILKDCA